MNINAVLEKAPAQIAKLSTDAENARFKWKNEELVLAQLEAKFHLTCKADDPDMTQGDLKAKVGADDIIYAKRLEVLTLESAYKKDLIAVESWVNAFTAARKVASLRVEEMRSLNDTVKGGA